MKLHILIEDDKKRTKSSGKRSKSPKPTTNNSKKPKYTEKQKAAHKAWANRMAQGKNENTACSKKENTPGSKKDETKAK